MNENDNINNENQKKEDDQNDSKNTFIKPLKEWIEELRKNVRKRDVKIFQEADYTYHIYDRTANAGLRCKNIITGLFTIFEQDKFSNFIDFNTFTPALSVYTNNDLKLKNIDLCFICKCNEEYLRYPGIINNNIPDIFIVIEHVTKIDPNINLRILENLNVLISHFHNNRPKQSTQHDTKIIYPHFLFLIIHQGMKWKGFTSFPEASFSIDNEDWPRGFSCHTLLFDFSTLDLFNLKSTPECEWFICLMQGENCLKFYKHIDLVAEKLKTIDPDFREYFTTISILFFYNIYRNKSRQIIEDYLISIFGKEVVKLSGTNIFAEYRDEGMAEGIAKGVVIGRVEGKAEGKAEGRAGTLREGIIKALSRKNDSQNIDFLFKIKLNSIDDLYLLDKLDDLSRDSNSVHDFMSNSLVVDNF